MREIQYFERENDPPPLTEPTESPGKTEKGDVLDDLDPEPSFSDLSSKKKKHDEKKKRCKHKKDNLSDPSSATIVIRPTIVITDSNDVKGISIWKKYPIKLCARLTENLPTTAYKSKIIRLKMYEDPLQRRIYFLTLVESQEMIFSQYTETYEVLLDDPKIGVEDNKYFSKKAIRNILHANTDVHIRRIISEFSADRIKCIEELKSHCANMNIDDKSRYDRIFSKLHIKEWNMQCIALKHPKMQRFYQFL